MDLNKVYDEFMDETKSVKSLGWSSEEAQQARFKVISEMGIEENDSVLDVGCGYGDFSKFAGSNYKGIDMREVAIKEASNRYQDKNFSVNNIFDITDKFDWVIASGIFCFREDNWRKKTCNTMQQMFTLANKGIAANFLVNYDGKQKFLKHTRPSEVMDHVIDKLGNKFVIRQDYLINDFTVYLYKS
jgi:cyclopropane fatty-acyl-phospholipid synthase-like methyltransferase